MVPLQGWNRKNWFDETGLQWILPSPNIPTLTTATLYPGTCLIEGTNLSEGRGTTRPFELIGAPWLDSKRLADSLNRSCNREALSLTTILTGWRGQAGCVKRS